MQTTTITHVRRPLGNALTSWLALILKGRRGKFNLLSVPSAIAIVISFMIWVMPIGEELGFFPRTGWIQFPTVLIWIVCMGYVSVRSALELDGKMPLWLDSAAPQLFMLLITAINMLILVIAITILGLW